MCFIMLQIYKSFLKPPKCLQHASLLYIVMLRAPTKTSFLVICVIFYNFALAFQYDVEFF